MTAPAPPASAPRDSAPRDSARTAAVVQTLRQGHRTRRRRWLLVTLTLAALIAALAALMLMIGETFYSPAQVVSALDGTSTDRATTFAVGTLRLPRLLAGAAAGAALGLAGSTFQTMLRNPLASPDIVGITSGSSAAAVYCIVVLGASQTVTSVVSLIAGLATAGLIYALAHTGESAGGRFILIGIGVGAMLDAVVSYLLLGASQWDIPAAMRWLAGSLNGAQMDEIAPVALTLAVLGTTLVMLTRNLAAMELGDPAAVALGVRVDRTRLALVLAAVGLAAVATSTTGPIAFVAFLSGPIAVRLVGTSGSPLVPAGLVGAALTLAADLLGQNAFGTNYPVGIVTGVLGAPYLMYLLVRLNRSGGSA